MHVYNTFQEMEAGTGTGIQGGLHIFNPEHADCAVENAINPTGRTPAVASTQSVGDAPPNTSQWRKTVDERLGNLERNVEQVKKDTAEILRRLPPQSPK